MTRAIASLYQYFCFKKMTSPYFRTIIACSGIVMFLFLLLIATFPIPLSFDFFGHSKSPLQNYISGALLLGLCYFVISAFFRKEQLEKYSFTEKQLRLSVRYFSFTVLIIFFLIMTISIFHIRDKW